MKTPSLILVIILTATASLVTDLFAQRKGSEQLAGVQRAELPTKLQFLRIPTTMQVEYDQLLALKETDKPFLRRYFQSEPKVAMRRGALWGLVFLGDEAVVGLITNTIANKNFRDIFDDRDMTGVSGMILALGFLGRTNDAAFAFLRRGIDAAWWDQARAWRAREYEHLTNARLVSYTIQSLGLTARTEGKDLIASLQQCNYTTMLPGGERWGHQGDMCAAVMYYEMQERLGWQGFIKRFFSQDSQLYEEWKTTESGKRHLRWFYQSRGRPVPKDLE
jgi:hypothetical protein